MVKSGQKVVNLMIKNGKNCLFNHMDI